MANTEEKKQAPRYLVSFGRRRGRSLRKTKQALVDTLLPRLSIQIPESEKLHPSECFDTAYDEYWLEIGFGGGEHVAHQAGLNPNVGIIGCEPYLNGISGMLTAIDEKALHNIRIYDDDARFLMDSFPDASISRAFILYPDPWPKIRHHNRRLVSTETLDSLARILKPGAQLRLATDDRDYCTWMLERALPHPEFEWQANACDDFLNPPEDWIQTRYEKKKAVNRGLTPSYLNFIRK